MGATSLDFKGSGLTEFPREEVFAHSETLEFLDISGNLIDSLPDDLGQLRRLRVLFASGNPIHHLPSSLGDCPSLSIIGFRDCGLESVAPQAFAETLEAVILTNNRLRELPPTIGHCRKLRKLMLTGNALAELPEALGNCTELELLRMAANQIATVPDWLTRMPKLAWLALGGNPLCSDATGAGEMESIAWDALEVLEILGQGASGVIRHAIWRQPNGPKRAVALKIFKGELTSDGLPSSEMAASLAAGRHPNLVPIVGRVSDHPQGAAALVMELIDRSFATLASPPSLQTITRDTYPHERRFPLIGVRRTALQVAESTAHLHERGILHGDLYAHNILWDAVTHRTLLGDFGAASRHDPRDGVSGALQRLEIRAFGLLLEELIERGEEPRSKTDWTKLEQLREACLEVDPARRPLFEEIVCYLSRA